MIRTRFAILYLVIATGCLWAQCPTQDNKAWTPGRTVYYSISSNITGTEASQLQQAIGNWNTANQSNMSDVMFAPADAQHAAVLTIANGTTATGVAAKTVITSNGNTVTSATMTIGINTLDAGGSPIYSPTSPGYGTVFDKVGQHEIGHTMGLNDVTGSQTAGATVMNQVHGTNDSQNYMPTTIKPCDNAGVDDNDLYQEFGGDGGGGGGGGQCGLAPEYSAVNGSGSQESTGGVHQYTRCTPILVDTTGSGFDLTDTAHGVSFDILANGHPQWIPWPSEASGNAWLVLDRNGNGVIDDATELFGNLTPQPASPDPNGFRALAEYDKPSNGGNGDGIIDNRDAIYSSLRLWIDKNHNGFSEPDELITLQAAGISVIDLNYQEAYKRDRNGNLFRYQSRIDNEDPTRTMNWKACYDVFLVNTPQNGGRDRKP